MFSLICAQINGWVNNGEAGDLRRHRVHYDVIVMLNNNHSCWFKKFVPKCPLGNNIQLMVSTGWGNSLVSKITWTNHDPNLWRDIVSQDHNVFEDQNIDGLVKDCSNTIALAMELLQPCAKPSIWYITRHFVFCPFIHSKHLIAIGNK